MLWKVWKLLHAKQVWEWQSMLSIMPRPMAGKESLRSTKPILWGRQMVFSSRSVGYHCFLIFNHGCLSFYFFENLCFLDFFIVLVVLPWSGWKVPWNSIRGGHHWQLLYDGMFCQLKVSVSLSIVDRLLIVIFLNIISFSDTVVYELHLPSACEESWSFWRISDAKSLWWHY